MPFFQEMLGLNPNKLKKKVVKQSEIRLTRGTRMMVEAKEKEKAAALIAAAKLQRAKIEEEEGNQLSQRSHSRISGAAAAALAMRHN